MEFDEHEVIVSDITTANASMDNHFIVVPFVKVETSVINAIIRDGEFHFNYYLFSVVARAKMISPGESIPLIGAKENGGYTVEACELDSCPHLLFPQIQTALIYTNKYRYQDDTLLGDELKHFYLPMLFDPETNRCLAI